MNKNIQKNKVAIKNKSLINIQVITNHQILHFVNHKFADNNGIRLSQIKKSCSPLLNTFQIVKAEDKILKQDDAIKLGQSFYLKYYFLDEYLSFKKIQDSYEYQFIKQKNIVEVSKFMIKAIEQDELSNQNILISEKQMVLCAFENNQISMKIKKQNNLFKLLMSRYGKDKIKMIPNQFLHNNIFNMFPFHLYDIQNQSYIIENLLSNYNTIELKTKQKSPLFRGIFQLQCSDINQFYVKSMYLEKYISISKNGTVKISQFKSQQNLFILEQYRIKNAQIFMIKNKLSGFYILPSNSVSKNILRNSLRIQKLNYEYLCLTAVFKYILEFFNDKINQYNVDKVIKFYECLQIQLQNLSKSKEFIQIQQELVQQNILQKLILYYRYFNAKTQSENLIRQYIVKILHLICKNNVNNIIQLLQDKKFISENFLYLQQTIFFVDQQMMQNQKLENYMKQMNQLLLIISNIKQNESQPKYINFLLLLLEFNLRNNYYFINNIKQIIQKNTIISKYIIKPNTNTYNLLNIYILKIYVLFVKYFNKNNSLPILDLSILSNFIKNSESNYQFRKLCSQYFIQYTFPQKVSLQFTIYIEQKQFDHNQFKLQSNQTQILEGIKEYATQIFQTKQTLIDYDHIIGIFLLVRLLRLNILNIIEIKQVCKNVVNSFIQFKIEYENYKNEYEFICQVIVYMQQFIESNNRLRSEETIQRLLNFSNNRQENIEEQMYKIVKISQQIENIDQIFSKVFYFIKISGNTKQNTSLFLKCQKLLQIYYTRATNFYNLLKSYKIIYIQQEYLKQFYQSALQLKNIFYHYQDKNSIKNGLLKVLKSIQSYQDQKYIFKIQLIQNILEFHKILFQILLRTDLEFIYQPIFYLLHMFCINNALLSQKILNFYEQYFSKFTKDYGQYKTMLTIVRTNIFQQLEYLSMIEIIMRNKQFDKEFNNIDFVNSLNYESNDQKKIYIKKIIKLILNEQNLLIKALNIKKYEINQSIQYGFIANTQLDYLIQCLKFLNNMSLITEYKKDLAKLFIKVLPLDYLINLIQIKNFFLDPNHNNVIHVIYQANMITFLSTYQIFDYLRIESTLKYLSTILQKFTTNLKNYNQGCEQKNIYHRQAKLQSSDEFNNILFFNAKYLTILLRESKKCLMKYYKQPTEFNSSNLSKINNLLALQISNLYENYLHEQEYFNNISLFNNSFKQISQDFKIQLNIKFYFNLNQKEVQNKIQLTDQKSKNTKSSIKIFKKQKEYYMNNRVEKSIFDFEYSEKWQKIYILETQNKQILVEKIIRDIKDKFMAQNTLHFLTEYSYNKNMFIKNINYENERLALEVLNNLIQYGQMNSYEYILDFYFDEYFISKLKPNQKNIELLFQITFKLMKNKEGDINKQVQNRLQNIFLKNNNQQNKKFIIKIIEDQLSLGQFSHPLKALNKIAQKIINSKSQDSTLKQQKIILVLKFVQLLCQSLNFQIKDNLGNQSQNQISVLNLFMKLFEQSLSCILTNIKQFKISQQKYDYIQQIMNTLNSLLSGPHRKNIHYIIKNQYYIYLFKILEINDCYNECVLKTNLDDHKVLEQSYQLYIRNQQEDFYNNWLKKELEYRRQSFNIILISKLKFLAINIISSIKQGLIQSQKEKIIQKINIELIQKNIFWLYEKFVKVYDAKHQKLIDQIYSYQQQRREIIQQKNMYRNPQQIKLNYLKQSLILKIGIQMYIILLKYYEYSNIKIIQNAIQNKINEKRIRRIIVNNVAVIYQLYRLIQDISKLLTKLIKKAFNLGAQYQIQQISQTQQKQNQQKFAFLSTRREFRKTIDFFTKNVATVEILIDNKKFQIAFPLLDQSRCLNKSIKNEFYKNIDYSSQQSKLSSFMKIVDYIILRLKFQKELTKTTDQFEILRIIIKNRQLWKSLSFTTACLQNFIFIMYNYFSESRYNTIMLSLKICQYFFAGLLLIIYYFQNFNLKKEISNIKINQKEIRYKTLFRIKEIMSDKTLFYSLFYIIITSFSFIQDLWVAVLLIDFFYRFKVGKLFKDLLYKPFYSILTNILLYFLLIYLFTVLIFVSHVTLIDSYPCDTIARCIQMFFDLQFKFLSTQGINNDPLTKYEESYLIFINQIFKILFLAIIVNQKKQEKRQSQLKRIQVEDKCFICGRTKQQVNKNSRFEKVFKKHLQLDHYLWNYVYYLIYLTNIKEQNLSMQQQTIINLWRKKSYEWLPYIIHRDEQKNV